MTYCVGILLPAGLVLASDSHADAGLDPVPLTKKLWVFEVPGERMIAVVAAGHLATTQAVLAALRDGADTGDETKDLHAAPTLYDAAFLVGCKLREVLLREDRFRARDASGGTFLVGGQIAGEAPRLFHVNGAGLFVEASERSRCLQLGEARYGRPILERALCSTTSLDEAAKLTLLSFETAMRSNPAVDAPVDLLRYATDSFTAQDFTTLEKDDPYWDALRSKLTDGLCRLVASMPAPPHGAVASTWPVMQ